MRFTSESFRKGFTAVTVLVLLGMQIGCGSSKKTTTTDATQNQDVVDNGNLVVPSQSLPGNLFDTDPGTSSTSSYDSVSSTEASCLANDAALFGFLNYLGPDTGTTSTTSSACTGADQASLLGYGVGGMQMLNNCLNAVYNAAPSDTDSQDVINQKFEVAGMAATRCVEHYGNGIQDLGWNQSQQNAFNANQGVLYILLGSYVQN